MFNCDKERIKTLEKRISILLKMKEDQLKKYGKTEILQKMIIKNFNYHLEKVIQEIVNIEDEWNYKYTNLRTN